VVVHHQRKMDAEDPYDTVSGTLGLTGGADTVMILRRDSTGTVILQARGQDVCEFEKAMIFDKKSCRWKIAGEAAQFRQSTARAAITKAMQEIGEPASPSEIATEAGLKTANVSKLLAKMARDQLVRKHDYGKYGLAQGGMTKVVLARLGSHLDRWPGPTDPSVPSEKLTVWRSKRKPSKTLGLTGPSSIQVGHLDRLDRLDRLYILPILFEVEKG
jgi:hypothetical protein